MGRKGQSIIQNCFCDPQEVLDVANCLYCIYFTFIFDINLVISLKKAARLPLLLFFVFNQLGYILKIYTPQNKNLF